MGIIKFFSDWNRSRAKTNADGVIGKEAIVTTEINNLKGTGAISYQGMDWTARTADGSVVSKDSIVKIVAIEGVKVIVENKKKVED